MILLDAKVNGKAAVLALDTGINRTLMSLEITGADKHDVSMAQHRGLYFSRKVYLIIGDSRWVNFPVLIVDMKQRSTMDIDGLLGEDVLSKFSSVRINFKDHVIDLER